MTKVKTLLGTLKYVFIDGEGRNTAMQGEADRFRYVVSYVVPKDSEAHKHLKKLIDEEWEAYKKQFGIKGQPKTNGIKEEMMKDPKGTIDPETEDVKRIPTGNIIATFSTNTKWPDGKDQVIKVYDRKGANITEAVHSAEWKIGNDSQGIVFGSAHANNIGGTHKVSLYLTGLQIAKLVKYEGSECDADELEGEDIDFGDDATPAL